MRTFQRISFVLTAVVAGLSAFTSCDKEDESKQLPSLNALAFTFASEGGTARLYTTDKADFEFFRIGIKDTATKQYLYEASMITLDSVLVSPDNQGTGKITYKDGLLRTLDTDWYSIQLDETADSRRYIIQAHPSTDGHEMIMGVSTKNTGITVRAKRH